MLGPLLPLFIILGVAAWWLRPGFKPSSPRLLAILATIIPPLAAGIVAVIFQLLHHGGGVADAANICFIIGLALIAVAILSAVFLSLTGKKEVAGGIGFGCCIAMVFALIELFVLEGLGTIE
jgi:hypothetical protein